MTATPVRYRYFPNDLRKAAALSVAPGYLVVGHVSRDLAADGASRAGGTATYSALTARRLGLRVGVVTSGNSEVPFFADEPSIAVHCQLAEHTTTFENVYSPAGRRQYIHALAGWLSAADLPPGWKGASIVHLGPVAQEVDPGLAGIFPNALLGVTPQGWLRRWDQQGLVSPAEWEHASRVLRLADVVVLSLADIGGDRGRLDFYTSLARLLVLTVGQDGAFVYCQGREHHVPAYVVTEVDPTGAGDVFAAAYLVRLHETGDAIEAARFANCAASFVVEGLGTANVPSREQIEWRVRHGQLKSYGREQM